MTEPSKSTVKRLFAKSGNTCAFPACQISMVEESGIVTGIICHIEAQSEGGPRFNSEQTENERHSFDNLILMCGRHHKIIDSESEIYTVEALKEMKSMHEGVAARSELKEDAFFAQLLINKLRTIEVSNNRGNVAIQSPGAIQAHTLTVKTQSKKVEIQAPPGTVGFNSRFSAYVSYLIKRYNKFAGSDNMRKEKFNYGAISRNIEANFGCSWRLIPEESAPKLFQYLQGRISKTRQARINKGNGHRAFSTYEEYMAKHGAGGI